MSLLFRLALMFTSGRFSDSNPVVHPISICSPYSCSVSLSAALLCRLLLRIMFPFILFFFCTIYMTFSCHCPFFFVLYLNRLPHLFFLCIFFVSLPLSPFLSRVLLFLCLFLPLSFSPKHFIRNILCRVSMMKRQLNSAYEIFSRLNFLNFLAAFKSLLFCFSSTFHQLWQDKCIFL